VAAALVSKRKAQACKPASRSKVLKQANNAAAGEQIHPAGAQINCPARLHLRMWGRV
jgi:hypothetical protein